jgi:hypothetical protein
LALLVLLGLIAFALTQDYVTDFATKQIENRGSDRQAQLDRILAATQAWYQANPGIESNSVTLDGPNLLAKVWPDYRSQISGLNAQMSPPQFAIINGTNIQYRVIAIWLSPPSAADTTSWTTTTVGGVSTLVPQFDPAVLASGLYRTWSTLNFEMSEVAGVAIQLQQVYQKIQDWAKSQTLQKSPLTSYLRANDCTNFSAQLPCVDTYTSILTSAAGPLLSLTSSDVATRWGAQVEFSNLDCSTDVASAVCSTSVSPFTASLRIQLPFYNGPSQPYAGYVYLLLEQ